jgi:hypothetical protein
MMHACALVSVVFVVALAACAPVAAVTAAASLPPTAAATGPKAAPAVRASEDPERDPQARGVGPDLYAAELPDDRGGKGLGDVIERCADPDRLEGCPRTR